MSGIIANAITHLKDLQENLRIEGHSFSSQDIENCDAVADLIQELENSVKALHSDLETETIKTSQYRHKLTLIRDDLDKEIEENVEAARLSHVHIMDNLKQKLNDINISMSDLHSKDAVLAKGIDELKPQTKSLAARHHKVIQELNKKMAEKAEAQIRVNETNDVLAGVNEKIKEAEEAILLLKEQVVKEKVNARNECDVLVAEKLVSIDLARKQEDANQAKCKEVEVLKSSLKDALKQAQIVVDQNKKLTEIMAGLEAELAKETADLDAHKTRLNDQIAEGIRIRDEDVRTVKEYDTNKAEAILDTEKAVERAKVEVEKLKELKEKHEYKKLEVTEVHNNLKAIQVSIEQAKEVSNKLQKECSEKLKQVVELEAKSDACYMVLGQAQEAHNQAMDSLMRESEEYRERLSHEKEQKMKNQNLRDANYLEIVNFTESINEQKRRCNAYLVEQKKKFDTLSERENFCLERIKFNANEKNRLNVELNTAKDNYKMMLENTNYKIERLEEEIRHFENEDQKLREEISSLEPGYKDLCGRHENTLKEFNLTKKTLIKAKALKKNMESNIEATEKNMKTHEIKWQKNKEELANKRVVKIDTMRSQAQDLHKLEGEILAVGLKSSTIKEQNDKFVQAIRLLETEYNQLDAQKLQVLRTREEIENEYDKITVRLIEGWEDDKDLGDVFVEKDQDLVKKLAVVLNRTKKREKDVDLIAEKLQVEIDMQTSYIEKMVGKVERSEMFDDV